jgi:uncharacterized protein
MRVSADEPKQFNVRLALEKVIPFMNRIAQTRGGGRRSATGLIILAMIVGLQMGASSASETAVSLAPAFFKVSIGDRSGFIIASTHGASPTPIKTGTSIAGVLSGIDHIAVESLPARNNGALNQKYIYRSDSSTLRSELPEQLLKRVNIRLRELNAPAGVWTGLDKIRIQFAPLILGTLFSELHDRMVKDPKTSFPGLDRQLLQLATERSLPISEVEGTEGALRATSKLSTEESIAVIENLLAQWDTGAGPATIDAQLLQAIRRVSAGQLEEHYAEYREFNCKGPLLASACDKEIDARNQAIALGIEKLFTGRAKTPLAAIGALHLAGPNSVLRILESRTFKVERVR